MTVAFRAPTTFTPAFSTTTTSPGTAAEGFSDLGLGMDSYEGAFDTAGSEELTAQITFGRNFVSGARLEPAGDMVARAKEFAEDPSAQAAGLFLARAGLLAAEGATGAGAGAGVALAAARSAAVLVGGNNDDIFAAGKGDSSGRRPGAAASQRTDRPTRVVVEENVPSLIEIETKTYVDRMQDPSDSLYSHIYKDSTGITPAVRGVVRKWFAKPLAERNRRTGGSPNVVPHQWFLANAEKWWFEKPLAE